MTPGQHGVAEGAKAICVGAPHMFADTCHVCLRHKMAPSHALGAHTAVPVVVNVEEAERARRQIAKVSISLLHDLAAQDRRGILRSVPVPSPDGVCAVTVTSLLPNRLSCARAGQRLSSTL